VTIDREWPIPFLFALALSLAVAVAIATQKVFDVFVEIV